MKYPDNHSEFKLLADGTVYARNGVQTNCGGIAKIHVRITLNSTRGITLLPTVEASKHDEGYGIAVPGADMPVFFRQAVFKGAQEAFEQSNPDIGICFELLDAFVHMVDGKDSRFQAAGWIAMAGWLECYADGLVQLTEGEQQKA